MKTWLTKLGIGRFEKDAAAVGNQLRSTRPRLEAPSGLHNSIMNAVRAVPAPSEFRDQRAGGFFVRFASIRPSLALACVAAPSFAALIVAVFWLSGLHSAPGPGRQPSFVAASIAVDSGDEMPQAIPSAVVAPLSDELQRVESDCDGGIQTVLASLP